MGAETLGVKVRGEGVIHPRSVPVSGSEGLVPAPSHSHSDPNRLPSLLDPDFSQDLSAGPWRPSFPQVGSSSRCALPEVGPGTVQRTARSAPTARGPFRLRRSSPPAPPGPSALPTRAPGRCAHRPAGGGGEALWVVQRGSPGAAGCRRRSPPGARPSRREQARRGGGAAPGPGGGAYIPGPSRRKPRRFLAGAGTEAATCGGGGTPGAGGLEGEWQPHPALAPAALSVWPAMAHPFF